jgi:hypothetical protein
MQYTPMLNMTRLAMSCKPVSRTPLLANPPHAQHVFRAKQQQRANFYYKTRTGFAKINSGVPIQSFHLTKNV